MAPTEGRVAKPDCRHGTQDLYTTSHQSVSLPPTLSTVETEAVAI